MSSQGSSTSSKKLNIACVSDVHVGHPRTPTRHILENLTKAFPDEAETGSLDIIFIAGDFFDRLLQVPDAQVTEIKVWINWFLRMCKRRDIVVRVLEGTPSHDWGQNVLFESVNELGEIGADIKYIKTLSIEHIERFGLHVLYVPDEWEPETDDTWKQVVELLENHGLKQVDFAVMHGAFPHQLPSHVQAPVHDPDRYLSIVRHYIFIGHVHFHSMVDRIISQGSFDRLAQGEEGPKGHVRVTLKPDGRDKITFVENKGAWIYKTIDCREMELDDALKKVDKEADVPPGSYLRVWAYPNDPIMSSMDVLRNRFPLCTWSAKPATAKTQDKELLTDLRATYTSTHITPDNVIGLLMDRIKNRTSDPRIIEQCEALLEGAT